MKNPQLTTQAESFPLRSGPARACPPPSLLFGTTVEVLARKLGRRQKTASRLEKKLKLYL